MSEELKDSTILTRVKVFIKERKIIEHSALTKTKETMTIGDNKLLDRKNVLLIGAGRNIGKSIALTMANQGANILFTDLLRKNIKQLEKELKNITGIKYQGLQSDISKTKDIDLLYKYLIEKDIAIDILVNNAGIQFEQIGIKNFKIEECHKTFNTNVIGPTYLTKLISEMMIAKKIQGSIIFITSIHQFTLALWPSYSASKAALGQIVEELAIELAPHQIRVNAIAPGWVAEDGEGNTLPHPYTPLYQTSISPDYIGRAVLYLACDYFSKFTTGTTLKIDGGLSLYNHRVEEQKPF
jgi:NAD(P)-dependent dehydrogenase (short-subunit alcohol dehydrogenase family)